MKESNERDSIRWAPLNVPLKRRLQTLVVLWHTISIPLFITAFFFLCAIPIFWPILIPYLIYLVFSNTHQSGTLRRRSNFFRSLPIWSLFASYFPARLHRSQELPPTRKYIFGYHPHGERFIRIVSLLIRPLLMVLCRNHLPRRLRRLCYRSPRLLPPLPGNNKLPSNPRFQLPHPPLSRIRPCPRPWLRLPHILRKPTLKRWN